MADTPGSDDPNDARGREAEDAPAARPKRRRRKNHQPLPDESRAAFGAFAVAQLAQIQLTLGSLRANYVLYDCFPPRGAAVGTPGDSDDPTLFDDVVDAITELIAFTNETYS